jgi:hypothetical protein
VARKAETTFISSVHRHLPTGVYREKMHNPYRSGTADVWYSGDKDMWVEYKFLPALPKRLDTPVTLDLSENQKIWLKSRHREGRTVAVICGCKTGGVVFEALSWDRQVLTSEFLSLIQTRQQIAQWLTSMTGEVVHGPTENTHRSGQPGQSNLQNSGHSSSAVLAVSQTPKLQGRK